MLLIVTFLAISLTGKTQGRAHSTIVPEHVNVTGNSVLSSDNGVNEHTYLGGNGQNNPNLVQEYVAEGSHFSLNATGELDFYYSQTDINETTLKSRLPDNDITKERNSTDISTTVKGNSTNNATTIKITSTYDTATKQAGTNNSNATVIEIIPTDKATTVKQISTVLASTVKAISTDNATTPKPTSTEKTTLVDSMSAEDATTVKHISMDDVNVQKQIVDNDTDIHETGSVALTISNKEVNRQTNTSKILNQESAEIGGIDVLVLCKCEAGEILSDDGKCLQYEGDMFIDEKLRSSHPNSLNKFITSDIQCDQQGQHLVQLDRGEFYFLPLKGYAIVNISSSEFNGMSIIDYCINYGKDELGNLTWTLTGCLSQSIMPLCCPYRQAMRNGLCQPADTPIDLNPPIFTETNKIISNLTITTNVTGLSMCSSETVKTISLAKSNRQLILSPTPLKYFWLNLDARNSDEYNNHEDFCIDGVYNKQGIIEYFVSFCDNKYINQSKENASFNKYNFDKSGVASEIPPYIRVLPMETGSINKSRVRQSLQNFKDIVIDTHSSDNTKIIQENVPKSQDLAGNLVNLVNLNKFNVVNDIKPDSGDIAIDIITLNNSDLNKESIEHVEYILENRLHLNKSIGDQHLPPVENAIPSLNRTKMIEESLFDTEEKAGDRLNLDKNKVIPEILSEAEDVHPFRGSGVISNKSSIRHHENMPSNDISLTNSSYNDESYDSSSASSLSDRVRRIVYPITYSISCIALIASILCHLMIPRMMKQGGLHHFYHAVFLACGNITSLFTAISWFLLPLEGMPCFWLAIIKQFGYTGAFFWLNIMCFELWRKTRSLKNFMRDHKRIPVWGFMVYGFGGPVLICLATIMVYFCVEEEVPGLFKPDISSTRCWFKGDSVKILYFYGPVGVLFLFNVVLFVLTFIEHRQLIKKYENNVKYLKKEGADMKKADTNVKEGERALMCIVDHVPEFTQKMRIFILCAALWMTDIFAFKNPPDWLWLFTDIINTLQGFILFLIMMGNRNKRKLMRKRFPTIFKMADKVYMASVNMVHHLYICKKRVPNSKMDFRRNSLKPNSSSISELSSYASSSSVSTISLDSSIITTSFGSSDRNNRGVYLP